MDERTDIVLAEETSAEEKEASAAGQDGAAPEAGGEFQITIRKLDMPVRPRGVLAE